MLENLQVAPFNL